MPEPKVYGTPTGVQQPITAGRQQPTQLSPEQLRAAYQQYMRTVVAQAHQHFQDHVQKQGYVPKGQSSISGVLGITPNKTIRRTDEAVESMSQ